MTEITMTDGSFESLSVGTHKAAFKQLEETETSKGAAYRWHFETLDGKKVNELSDREYKPTPQNKTGRFLQALASRTLKGGDTIDPAVYVGKTYLLIVEPKGDGKTKITTFTAL
jgi:hypothetical protein